MLHVLRERREIRRREVSTHHERSARERRSELDGQAFVSAAGATRSRSEDVPLVTGGGASPTTWTLPGQAHAVFVRATVAHADIRQVDAAAARACRASSPSSPGRSSQRDGIGAIPPVAVFTGRDGKPMFRRTMPVLAADRVRYVGEPVALVVAETVAQALRRGRSGGRRVRSARRRVGRERALAADAPPIWPEAPGNIALDWEDGDAAAVDAAFARAAHVERVRLIDTRLAPSAMEPRAAIATLRRRRPSATR